MLDSTNGVSSKSIGNHAQLNIMNKLYPVTLIKALLWNDTNMHMCSSNRMLIHCFWSELGKNWRLVYHKVRLTQCVG